MCNTYGSVLGNLYRLHNSFLFINPLEFNIWNTVVVMSDEEAAQPQVFANNDYPPMLLSISRGIDHIFKIDDLDAHINRLSIITIQ